MKTPDDQLLARWLDGELNEQETTRFESMMAADPALREEAETMRKISSALRDHVKMEREVPHADFFNSQIQERIADMQRAEERAHHPAASASAADGWFSWLRKPWALAGVAAVLTTALFISRQEKPATQILSFYAPNPSIQASAFHSEAADATVLMLDGLDTIPADHNIVGIHVHHSELQAERGATTLFDDDGAVLLVMSKNSGGHPVFASR
jgi:anti-sigma factor RsiW